MVLCAAATVFTVAIHLSLSNIRTHCSSCNLIGSFLISWQFNPPFSIGVGHSQFTPSSKAAAELILNFSKVLAEKVQKKMAGPIQKGHAMGALVIGVMEIVFGLIIMICSFVLGGKLKKSATLTPYWAGIPVSFYIFLCYFIHKFY